MKKTILLLTIALITLKVTAQTDSTKARTTSNSRTYTFSLDGYYRNDFASQVANNKTSFTNSNNALALGMASLKVDQTLGKFTGTLDIGVGKRAKEFSYNDAGIAQSIKQAYLSFSPNSILKFTAGKWATHIGYELLDAYANRNYSMSYGFSYGPFFHTGLRADIALGGKTAMMIGVAQPTDFVSSSSLDKMIIAQLSSATKDDKLKAYLNYQGGKNKTQVDLVLNGVVSSKVAINYDGTLAKIAGSNWTSNAFYFNYDPSAKIGFTWRAEFFDDAKNAVGVGTTITQNTFSANIHLSKFTIIPEIRFDNAGDKVFINKSAANTKGSGSFLIAAIYKF